MAKRLTSAQLDRRQKLALARENYYKNRPASTLTTVKKREVKSLVYASQGFLDGADSILYRVPCSTAALTFFNGLVGLGLRNPEAVSDPIAAKPRGFKPSQVSAMVATATPTPSISPWGTRVIKYSAPTTGTAQAHYTAPISGIDPLVTFAEINDKATALFTAIKSKLGDLDYARFYLSPEQFNISKN